MTGTLYANTIEKANGDPVDLTGQATAKAWGTSNGSTPVMLEDFGVGSLTDDGTGLFDYNLSVAMSSSDYSIQVSAGKHTDDGREQAAVRSSTTTSVVAFATMMDNSSNSNLQDRDYNTASIFGDLA